MMIQISGMTQVETSFLRAAPPPPPLLIRHDHGSVQYDSVSQHEMYHVLRFFFYLMNMLC